MAKLFAPTDPGITKEETLNMERSRAIAASGMVLLKNEGALPFEGVRTVAAFGAGVRRTIKGGTGSGDVNSRVVINVEQGLKEAGFEITSGSWLDRHDRACEEALAQYKRKLKEAVGAGGFGGIMFLFNNPYFDPDPPEILPEDLKEKADACLYVITRNSGEGKDRTTRKGDYELSDAERQNIEALSAVYGDIAVVLNVGGVIDTSYLRSCKNVKAILNMSQAGNISGRALADVLTGRVGPSGRLAMTWAEKYSDYPCSDTFSYMNGDLDDEYYREGIYVGYRWFDTFGIEPAYPFGYGLGYTTFRIGNASASLDGTDVVVSAEVENTGGRPGREVVQVYCSAPEGSFPAKPCQQLAAFAKTGEIAPGKSESVTVRFPVSSLASYCEKCASWVLSPGRYYVRVGEHSRSTHICAALELDERTVVSKLKNLVQPDAPIDLISPDGAKPWTYPGEEDEKAAAPVLPLRSKDIPCDEAAYSPEPEPLTTDRQGTVTLDDVLSGKACVKDLAAQLTVEEMADLCVGARAAAFGANSTIGAASSAVPGAAGDTTSALIEKRGVPNIVLADGPAGLRLSAHFVADKDGTPIPALSDRGFGGFDVMAPAEKPVRPEGALDYYQYCTAIPIATLLAQTWDMDAVEEAGDIVGGEMEKFGVTLWLAPGMNIQRNPLCGRNFEYYSEDPLIAGLCAAADTRGVQKHPGCGTTIKHYCLNNNEDDRNFINCHATERALREIYLKGFEIAVRQSRPLSLMTSYNLVNGEHAANKYDTVTAILRDEWGFDGFVMTDWGTTGHGRPDDDSHKYPTSDAAGCIKAGNDLIEPGTPRDVETIVKSVGAAEGTVRCPITKAELQRCALNILNVIVRCEKAKRAL